MGPSKPDPLSPLLCMHMPKPITIQGCYMGSCGDVPLTSDVTPAVRTEVRANLTEEGHVLSPTPSHKDTPQHRVGYFPQIETITFSETTIATPTPKPS